MTPGVLALVVDIKAVGVVFDRAGAVPPAAQFGNQAFQERGFAASLFAHDDTIGGATELSLATQKNVRAG